MEVSVDDGRGPGDPALDRDTLIALYRAMARAHLCALRLASLSDDGAIGYFPAPRGDEAAVIGATFALRERDWIFPAHGDFGAALLRGMSLSNFVHRAFGDRVDPLQGRDMPTSFSARAQRVASASAPPATHLPHAVGCAWSARQRGEDVVAAAFFDGAEVDAADFHTGLNFAGVMRAPVLFVCRRREGEPSAAERAIAYGIASARCDGGDLSAVIAAVRAAAEQARGGVPAALDLELDGGEPLARTRAHLAAIGALSDDDDRRLRAAIEDELDAAVDAARREGPPDPDSIFEDVYARVPAHLEEQRGELRAARPSSDR